MKVGYHAPLPPAHTGVADYAAALLRGLRPLAEVAPGADRADAHLYQLGNNQLHRDIYRRALAQPGVVVLHDAVLHHFYLGALGEQEYVEEFVYNYGEWSRDLAGELWRQRARSGGDAQYFEYAMLRRIAEVSRAVVVHNPGAAAMVRRHAPRACVVEIPHLFEPPAVPPRESEVLVQRGRWGIGPRACVFGVFGHLRETKRLPAVLRAFARFRCAGGDGLLLVAGAFASSDLERVLGPLLDSPGVRRIGYVPEREFWLNAYATDACINLRYPAAGETSGITVRFMGIGRPVMVTGSAETAALPEIACLRVDAGPAEEEMLASYMLWLCRFPEAGREIGRRAAAHIASEHAPAAVARRYIEVLSRV